MSSSMPFKCECRPLTIAQLPAKSFACESQVATRKKFCLCRCVQTFFMFRFKFYTPAMRCKVHKVIENGSEVRFAMLNLCSVIIRWTRYISFWFLLLPTVNPQSWHLNDFIRWYLFEITSLNLRKCRSCGAFDRPHISHFMCGGKSVCSWWCRIFIRTLKIKILLLFNLAHHRPFFAFASAFSVIIRVS